MDQAGPTPEAALGAAMRRVFALLHYDVAARAGRWQIVSLNVQTAAKARQQHCAAVYLCPCRGAPLPLPPLPRATAPGTCPPQSASLCFAAGKPGITDEEIGKCIVEEVTQLTGKWLAI